jgi:hypothetical protein
VRAEPRLTAAPTLIPQAGGAREARVAED